MLYRRVSTVKIHKGASFFALHIKSQTYIRAPLHEWNIGHDIRTYCCDRSTSLVLQSNPRPGVYTGTTLYLRRQAAKWKY